MDPKSGRLSLLSLSFLFPPCDGRSQGLSDPQSQRLSSRSLEGQVDQSLALRYHERRTHNIYAHSFRLSLRFVISCCFLAAWRRMIYHQKHTVLLCTVLISRSELETKRLRYGLMSSSTMHTNLYSSRSASGMILTNLLKDTVFATTNVTLHSN